MKSKFINFNNIEKSESNCVLFINSEYKPTLKISFDGLVFYRSSAPTINIGQIACLYKQNQLESLWYNYDLILNFSDDLVIPNECTELTVATRSNCYLNTDKLNSIGVSLTPSHEALKNINIYGHEIY